MLLINPRGKNVDTEYQEKCIKLNYILWNDKIFTESLFSAKIGLLVNTHKALAYGYRKIMV